MASPTTAEILQSAKSSDDEVFRSKFVLLPGYLRQWTEPEGGFSGKRVLDFGCGNGTTACAVAATCEPLSVEGVDINQEHQSCGSIVRKNLGIDLPKNLSFRTLSPGEQLAAGRYDIVYSWSVFEHIDRELFDSVVSNIRESLTEDGLLFVQIAPLYYSAEGSHLTRYGVRSWEHLSLQLNRLRALVFEHPALGQEEKCLDWSCFETLNKMTASELVNLVHLQGFTVVRTYHTHNSQEPPFALSSIFDREVLQTEQIVALFRKTSSRGDPSLVPIDNR